MRWSSRASLPLSLAAVVWSAPAAPAEDAELDWRWRRFQAWEYAATAVMLGTAFPLRFARSGPHGDWKGGILFDDWVRERATLDNEQNRATVDTVADLSFYGAMAYRFVDSALVPSIVWGEGVTALEMSMIDLEAFGLVAITLWGPQAVFGRQRPWVDRCDDPEVQEVRDCTSGATDRNRSFYAGHPAVSMAAAGLTCTHHSHLPLYGGGAADTLACGVTIGAAAFTAGGRILTEKHYATDVAIGLGIGAFAGFGLPELLHYDHLRAQRSKETARQRALNVRASVTPMLGRDRLGLAMAGTF